MPTPQTRLGTLNHPLVRNETVLSHTRRVKLDKLLAGRAPYPELSTMPLVSVIILNQNGKEVLPRCIAHLENQTYKNFEVIVVDNFSHDGSREYIESLRSSFPIKKLFANKNLGVAGGRNFAISSCSGSVLAFMDNDGYPEPLWLEESQKCLFSDKSIGAVGSLVFFARDLERVNSFGGMMDSCGHASDPDYGVPLENLSLREEVLYPMGCGMILRRDIADKLFPLDDTFLKWYDDTEIGIRVWNLGFRVLVTPYSIIDHDAHSGDVNRERLGWKRALLFDKARIRTVLKYFPIYSLPRWMIHDTACNFRKLFKGKFASVAVTVMALTWNIWHLPSILKGRIASLSQVPPFWRIVKSYDLERTKSKV